MEEGKRKIAVGEGENTIEENENLVKKGFSKRRVLMGVAAGAALLGIGLFLGNKFGIEGLRTFPTSKGTRPIVNGVVEAMEQAPGLGVAGGQKVVKVGWFIRRLPGGWHASPEAIEYASAVGVRLDENQTIVQPQIKTYGRTA